MDKFNLCENKTDNKEESYSLKIVYDLNQADSYGNIKDINNIMERKEEIKMKQKSNSLYMKNVNILKELEIDEDNDLTNLRETVFPEVIAYYSNNYNHYEENITIEKIIDYYYHNRQTIYPKLYNYALCPFCNSICKVFFNKIYDYGNCFSFTLNKIKFDPSFNLNIFLKIFCNYWKFHYDCGGQPVLIEGNNNNIEFACNKCVFNCV